MFDGFENFWIFFFNLFWKKISGNKRILSQFFHSFSVTNVLCLCRYKYLLAQHIDRWYFREKFMQIWISRKKRIERSKMKNCVFVTCSMLTLAYPSTSPTGRLLCTPTAGDLTRVICRPYWVTFHHQEWFLPSEIPPWRILVFIDIFELMNSSLKAFFICTCISWTVTNFFQNCFCYFL